MVVATKNKRMTLETVWRSHWNRELNSGVPSRQKAAAKSVLARKGGFEHILRPVRNCSKKYPCNKNLCDACSNPKRRPNSRHVDTPEDISRHTCNSVGTRFGKLSSNYRVRAGQKGVEPFVDIPLILLHAVTVNLTLVPVDGDLKPVVDRYRRRLRRCLDDLSPGAMARGKLDMVLKFADGLKFELAEDELPDELKGIQPPHRRFGMLHIHFALFDPWMSRSQVREIIERHFPGSKRICLRRPYEDVLHPDGSVSHGLQGFLEYAAMQKIELDFGDESVDAVVEFFTLDKTLSRRSRSFAYGKRADDLLSQIDQGRVLELEAEFHREKVKERWNKLEYAEKFFHIWMTDAKGVLEIVRTRKLGNILRSLKGYISGPISNWSRYILSQVIGLKQKLGQKLVELFGSLALGQSP